MSSRNHLHQNNKKKYGNNLHSLKLQPPPPPISNLSFSKSSTATREKSSLQSISKDSNRNISSNSSSGNGLLLLSTKKSDRSSSTLGNSANTKKKTVKGISTHDALVNALNGNDGIDAEEVVPLAWGKKAPPVSSPSREQDNLDNIDTDTPHDQETFTSADTDSSKIKEEKNYTNLSDGNSIRIASEISVSNDSAQSTASSEQLQLTTTDPEEKTEDQVEFMKKLAKERAEKRRREEDDRIAKQKERANQRLVELELKMKKKDVEDKMSNDITNSKEQHHMNTATRFSDPSGRTYSSLLGGTSATSTMSKSNIGANSIDEGDSREPKMIQFNSYDDRDRGSRSSGAGPRMLFDPKSGSMVAVTSPSSKEKKSSSKKKIMKNHENKKSTRHTKDESFGRNENTKTETNKRSLKRDVNQVGEGSTPSSYRSDAPHSNTKANKDDRNLPRTCGVLYVRDAKGRFISADGCEGDQGYGAHSVPGGKIRNPQAYSEYKQREKSLRQVKKSPRLSPSSKNVDATFGPQTHQTTTLTSSMKGYDYSKRSLNRSDFMRKSKLATNTDGTNTSKGQTSLNVVDNFTGNDELDLLSGIEASPKLQATAAAWAPSEAVLALATTKKNKSDDISLDNKSEDDIINESVHDMHDLSLSENGDHLKKNEDLESSIGLGLGFDPSNLSMMMSPALNGEADPSIAHLGNFGLDEPALPKSSSNSMLSAAGILGGGTSTWGATNGSSMGSLSNWDVRSSNENANEGDPTVQKSSNSFLSFGVGRGQSTWGNGNSSESKFGAFIASSSENSKD